MPDLHLSDVKERNGEAAKMENKQVGKKTVTTSLDMVIFSRLRVCDPRDNGIC